MLAQLNILLVQNMSISNGLNLAEHMPVVDTKTKSLQSDWCSNIGGSTISPLDFASTINIQLCLRINKLSSETL